MRPGAPQAIPTSDKPKPTTNTPPAADGNDARPQWTGIGTLRRSVLTPDGTGKPAYALEASAGVVKVYVTAGAGVELEKFVGKRVDVYGAPQTKSGLSKPYVVATAIEQAP